MTSQLSAENQTTSLLVPELIGQTAVMFSGLLDTNTSELLLEWLNRGFERGLLQMVSEGQLSVGRLVEILDITYYDVPELSRRYGIDLGPTPEQSRHSLEKYGSLVAMNRKSGCPE